MLTPAMNFLGHYTIYFHSGQAQIIMTNIITISLDLTPQVLGGGILY